MLPATLPHEAVQYSTHCDAVQSGTWLPTVRNNMASVITSLLQGLQLTHTRYSSVPTVQITLSQLTNLPVN